jgi:hypothetical protein
MLLDAMPVVGLSLESMSSESRDEQLQQQQYRSPVDVIVGIREDLAEFRQRDNSV